MQVASRTNRRYITPSPKLPATNIRPVNKKPTNSPAVIHPSPKKASDVPAVKSNEPPTLKKLVDRFRYDEPQPRPERDSTNSDFWWLHDELKATYVRDKNDDADKDDERKSNVPEFIEIFPSTDIDQDLHKRASLLLHQTCSAHSSDTVNVSSTGIGSTPSATLTTTSTTTSAFQPVIPERPARPIFTRNIDPKHNFLSDGSEDDILYQWRLRRRLEQAQNGEPITFPKKVISRTNASPTRPYVPTLPIEVPTVFPARPPSPSVPKLPSPKRERQISSASTEEIKPSVIATPARIRQYSEAATQTIQDVCIQTSLSFDNHLSASACVSNDVDYRPTRDTDQDSSSIWHRPPARSKYESTRTSSSCSSSPAKRHHHSLHPIAVVERLPTNDQSLPQKSHVNPLNTVQCSQDSTLTQVTSIMVHDNNNNNDVDNSYDVKNNNNSIPLITSVHEQQHQEQDIDNDHHLDYSNDEILNILIKKRNELEIAFREIEQRLATITA